MAMTRLERLLRKIEKKENGCWEWTGTYASNGYGRFHWGQTEDGRDIVVVAHRAMWMLIKGEIDEHLMLRHMCNNSRCCNPEHLKPGTHKENMRDRDESGRTPKGENHYYYKRRPELLDQIKQLRKEGYFAREVCEKLDISWNTYFRCVKQDEELKKINKEARSKSGVLMMAHRTKDRPETIARGSACHLAVLDDEKIREIRKMAENGIKQVHIAQHFGVTPITISTIVRRITWKHVT